MGFLTEALAGKKAKHGLLDECGPSYYDGGSSLGNDPSDVQDVVDAYGKAKRRLAKAQEQAVKSPSPREDRWLATSLAQYVRMLQEVAELASSNAWSVASDRKAPDARIVAIEERLTTLAKDLPGYLLAFLGDAPMESVKEGFGLLSEKVFKLVTQQPSAAKRAAKHLSVGATKTAFLKVWEAFKKDNAEATLDDFKIAILVMADALAGGGEAEE